MCTHPGRLLTIAPSLFLPLPSVPVPQAEEEAWARLPTVVPCPPESEGTPSDADEAYRTHDNGGRGVITLTPETARRGQLSGSGSPDRHGLHTDLEIEIPACDGEGLDAGAEALRAGRGRGRGAGSRGEGGAVVVGVMWNVLCWLRW